MKTTNYLPLNSDIAVSPRMHKALLHACRILDSNLDEYLHSTLECEIRALRDIIQANNKQARKDAYIMQHLSDPPPADSECEYVDIELDGIQAAKLEKAARGYGITPERYIQLIVEAEMRA